MENKSSKRLSLASWCLYDWANSAFSTVIITFIYSVYFARSIIGDETQGSAYWGYAIALSGFFVAILSPILGAIADHYGARKRWLCIFAFISMTATACLWWGIPTPSLYNTIFVLILVTLANIGFELSLVFYNAMLPHIAPKAMIGRISGWAWALGYIGGLSCLLIALFGLIGLGDGLEPIFDLPQENSEHIRASAPLTAIWFLLFSIPLFIFTHDVEKTGLSLKSSVQNGLSQLWDTIRKLKKHKNLLRFLIASAIYRDGLSTLFAVGGLYAAGTFGMSFQEIMIFAIGLNITAGLGAFAFSFIDDKIGSKQTIIIALIGLISLGGATLLIDDKDIFLIIALGLGLFIGPAQAASRTLAARLSTNAMTTQTFGLYAFAGKSIAFLGPLFFALATDYFDSQRAGIATILFFWLAGLALLLKVREN